MQVWPQGLCDTVRTRKSKGRAGGNGVQGFSPGEGRLRGHQGVMRTWPWTLCLPLEPMGVGMGVENSPDRCGQTSDQHPDEYMEYIPTSPVPARPVT